MRKQRNLLRKNWTNLRAQISKTIIEQNILETEFRPLSIHENWKEIEDKIYQTFCKLTSTKERPCWIWTNFKLEYEEETEITYYYMNK